MALKKLTETAFGITINNAYYKVESVTVLEKTKIVFQVFGYVDLEHPQFEQTTYACAYNISGENPIKQAYLHLKTLPEFAGATDC